MENLDRKGMGVARVRPGEECPEGKVTWGKCPRVRTHVCACPSVPGEQLAKTRMEDRFQTHSQVQMT